MHRAGDAAGKDLDKSTFVVPPVVSICPRNKTKQNCFLTSSPPFHHALSLLYWVIVLSFTLPALVNASVQSAAGEFILALHPVR